jgi:hypothetical protein
MLGDARDGRQKLSVSCNQNLYGKAFISFTFNVKATRKGDAIWFKKP